MSVPPPAGASVSSTRAAPPLRNVSPSLSRACSSMARSRDKCGSWPTRPTVASGSWEASTEAISSKVPPARASTFRTRTFPQAFAAISAVRRARGSGLVRSTAGRSTTRARPRAAWRKRSSPSGVSGLFSSGTPGVPLGTAMACRIRRTRIRSAPCTSGRLLPAAAFSSFLFLFLGDRDAPAHEAERLLQNLVGVRLEELLVQLSAEVLAGGRQAACLCRFLLSSPLRGQLGLPAEPLRQHPGIVHLAQELLDLLEAPRRLGRTARESGAELGRVAQAANPRP